MGLLFLTKKKKKIGYMHALLNLGHVFGFWIWLWAHGVCFFKSCVCFVRSAWFVFTFWAPIGYSIFVFFFLRKKTRRKQEEQCKSRETVANVMSKRRLALRMRKLVNWMMRFLKSIVLKIIWFVERGIA